MGKKRNDVLKFTARTGQTGRGRGVPKIVPQGFGGPTEKRGLVDKARSRAPPGVSPKTICKEKQHLHSEPAGLTRYTLPHAQSASAGSLSGRNRTTKKKVIVTPMKRIALFILTNIAVVVMLGVILSVVSMLTGINFGQMAGKNLNVGALFVFALVVGFAGSIISLFMSKSMAKMSMGVQMINTDNPSPGLEQWLVGVVRAQADKLGLKMPEVGIYEGEPNAFATGATKNSSLVAVSTGLLRLMNQKEVEAVLAHEMSHVANGDMVTMTLIQGVTNTFVVFFSRLIGWVVDRQILRNEDDAPGIGYYVTSIVLDIAFGLLAGIIVAAFSRHREYRADAGAAHVMNSPEPMISALQRLGTMQPAELPAAVKGFGISGGIGSLFASHPSIEDRIAALRNAR
jgi:protease htpX homolog